MKLPLIGETKPVYLYAGGAILIVGYVLWRKKQTAASAAAAQTSTTPDPNAIDPATGMTYAEEAAGTYGATPAYGGIDPATGIPYANENTQPVNTLSSSPITSNEQWATEALQDGQELGATGALTEQAIQDYLSQSPTGLPGGEYELMQGILGLIGPPPVGSFRLIQQTAPISTSTPPPPPPTSPPPPALTGTNPPSAATHLTPYVVQHNDTLYGIASSHHESLSQLEADNPVYLTNPKYEHGDLIFAGDTVMLEE